MSKSDAYENALLLLIFQNANFANVGDATGVRGSTTAGSLFLSLHTADPGEAGTQATSETSVGSYARVGAARSSSGWDVSGSTANLHATAAFPAVTSGSATATFAGIGTASSGAGILLYSGAITPNITLNTGVTPQLTTASTITED